MGEFPIANRRSRLERIFQGHEQLFRAFERVRRAIEFDPAVTHGGFDPELRFQRIEIARLVIEQLLRDPRIFKMKCFRGHKNQKIIAPAPGGVDLPDRSTPAAPRWYWR